MSISNPSTASSQGRDLPSREEGYMAAAPLPSSPFLKALHGRPPEPGPNRRGPDLGPDHAPVQRVDYKKMTGPAAPVCRPQISPSARSSAAIRAGIDAPSGSSSAPA